MTANGWFQIAVLLLVLLAVTKPLGIYLYRVLEGQCPPLARFLRPLERLIFWLSGVDPNREQNWRQYTAAMLLFSLCSLLATYVILRLQYYLPLNPQGFAGVEPWLAFNTAVSFTTNTNWQSYAGEITTSHFSQMAGLAWHNFISAATGIAVAMAVARGFTRRRGQGEPRTIGNFWADLVRSTVYVLIPICIIGALVLVSQGVVQNFHADVKAQTLEGTAQTLPMGPVASQEVIKEFGTNGGGFYNANSAHPFENPTPFSNFMEILLILGISSSLTYTYGRMAGNQRHGWVIWSAMAAFLVAGIFVAYWAESAGNPAARGIASLQTQAGNMEGKEVRFGVTDSALFAAATTGTSCGAVNAMHDSYTPLGGLVPLLNIELGEVVFGGVGAGLYAMLIFVVLTVFIAGLMVGRTPEYLGKKIEGHEMKLVMLYVLIFPLIVLAPTACSLVSSSGLAGLNNAGPHGLSEILYAYSSCAGNNGSAFAGLSANTNWYNITLGLTMLAGRFLMMVPVLALAGAMVGKKTTTPGLGTFPTDGWLFLVLLIGVIFIVGALTFFPALALGPVVEHFLALNGKVF